MDVLTPRFTAMSCVPDSSPSVVARLAELKKEGILEYENARTSTP